MPPGLIAVIVPLHRTPHSEERTMEPILIPDTDLAHDGTAELLVHAWRAEQLPRLGLSRILAEMFAELVAARRVNDPLEDLSPREREVLALMAEGRSNAGIARQLWVTEGTVEKHVHSILMKLRLPETEDDHRRVLAVVTYLDAR